MTPQFITGMILIATFAGLLMAATQWASLSPRYKRYRIRTPETYRIPLRKRIINIGGNMAFSVSIFTVALVFFHDRLFNNEPAAGLNPRESAALNKLLLDIKHETGTSILLIEHDLDYVRAISSRVVALHQGLACFIINTFALWRVVLDVVDPTGSRVYPTTAQARHDGVVVHCYLNHVVQVDTGVNHGFCLRNSPGKAIEQEPIGAIRFADTLFYEANDDVIGHETTRIHN